MNVFGFGGRSKSMRERPTGTARTTQPRPSASGTTPSSDLDKSMSQRTERLQERIASHDRELLRLRGELRATKSGTRQHKFYAKRAAQVLSQKKGLEKRLAAAMNMRYNLTVAQDEAAATAELAALQPSRSEVAELGRGQALLEALDSPDPDEVDQVVEDIREQMRDVEEVTQMLGSDDLFEYGGVDDAELEEELMRDMNDMSAPDNVDDVDADDYLRRIDDLMPVPHQANPQAYRPPPKAKDVHGKQPGQQQRQARRGGQ